MFSDALDREAAWLNSSGDGLPALAASAGGPFQIVQARWPRVPATSKTGLYVLRSPARSAHIDRFASQRTILTTGFDLRLLWKTRGGSGGTGSAESDQLAFEQAIDAVIARVQGPLGDKTHGGRFLSVAEDHAGIDVAYGDPERALADGILTASITYQADDTETNN